MPEIVGHFPLYPDPSRMAPCVLCLEATDTLAVAPGLGREVPLHVFCAAWIVRAYGRRGGRLSEGDRVMIESYAVRVAELGVPSQRKESS